MECSGLRRRKFNQISQSTIEDPERLEIMKPKIIIINVEEYYYLGEKMYRTTKDNFVIKELDYWIYCIIGKLRNNKVVPLIIEEEKRCRSIRFLIGDIVAKE